MFSAMKQSKIEVRPMPLGDLLSAMAQGQLQMPRFQREFVWPVTKTRALLDSMFKEFPIGTLFFWQAPPDQKSIFREMTELGIPGPTEHQMVSYILDGQQRLTSLFAAGHALKLGSRDFGKICLDLDAAKQYDATKDDFEGELFVTRRSPDNARYVRFHDVLNGELAVYDGLSAEGKQVFQTARQRFTTYPFSVVWVRDQPLGEVVEIFQRINQGGKRLSSYDLVCANLWSQTFNFRQQVAALNKQLETSGFGKIDEIIVPQAITLILSGKSSRAEQLRLTSERVEQVWPKVKSALMRAVDFMRSNLGVKRAEFLPYGGILSLMTMFFHGLNGKALTAEARTTLWNWFWWTSASEHYSFASREKINTDAERLKELLTGKKVAWPKSTGVKVSALRRVSMRSKTSALRNTVLCMLSLQEPRNFKDGSPVNLSLDFFSRLARAERHHIFPVNFLKARGYDLGDVHLIPNFAFIPAELNREISDKAPSAYMVRYKEENPSFEHDMATHLIPITADSGVWTDDYDSFLNQRASLLVGRLNQLLEAGPDTAGEPDEPFDVVAAHKEVEDIEIQLRDLIDSRLRAVGGTQYWKSTAPDKLQAKVNRKIGQHLTDHPFLDPGAYTSGRKRLDFCDIGDYIQLIRMNWSHFSSTLGKQDVAFRHLDDFRKYRNFVAHNNFGELTDSTRKNGEAAMWWLQRVFESESTALDEGDGGE